MHDSSKGDSASQVKSNRLQPRFDGCKSQKFLLVLDTLRILAFPLGEKIGRAWI